MCVTCIDHTLNGQSCKLWQVSPLIMAQLKYSATAGQQLAVLQLNLKLATLKSSRVNGR